MVWLLVGGGVVLLALWGLYVLGGRELEREKAARAPLRLTKMYTTGFLVFERAGQRPVEEALPPSPHGHGEFPTAVWGPGDGSYFVVGKQYTGVPGPDDGALYKKGPQEPVRLLGTVPGHTFHSLCGGKGGQVHIGALGGVAFFDGQRLSFTPLAKAGMVYEVWSEQGKVFAQSFDHTSAYALSGPTATEVAPRQAPDQDLGFLVEGALTVSIGDRSVEVGEREVRGDEAKALRDELAEVQRAVEEGSAKVRPVRHARIDD